MGTVLSRAGFFVLALFPTVSSCATVNQVLRSNFKEPKVDFRKLHLRDVSFEDVTMDFEFLVTNPNDVSVKLNSLDYALDIEGKSLAKGQTEQALRLKANGSAPVRLPLTVTFTDFVDNLATFFSSKETVPYAIAAGFGLDTPIGDIRLPVNNRGTVPLPKIPEVEVQDVKLSDVGLTGAKVAFHLGVKNKGQFPVKPKGLLYNVALAGTSISSGQETLPTLNANQTQNVVIPLQVNFVKLGTAVVSAIRKKSLPYEVKGDIDLGLFKQPFRLNGRAKL